MFGLIIFITVVLILIVLIAIAISILNCNPKVNVRELSVNSSLSLEHQILRSKIEILLPDHVYLVIIQDDICFSNSKYYWPKGYAFIHISDVNRLAQKYSYELLNDKQSSNLSDELKFLVKAKILLP